MNWRHWIAKWAQRLARLEAMILAKSFTVPVELIQQTSTAIVITERPFIPWVQSVAGPSAVQPTCAVTKPLVRRVSSTSPLQATGQDARHPITATQPVESPTETSVTQSVGGSPVPCLSFCLPVQLPLMLPVALRCHMASSLFWLSSLSTARIHVLHCLSLVLYNPGSGL